MFRTVHSLEDELGKMLAIINRELMAPCHNLTEILQLFKAKQRADFAQLAIQSGHRGRMRFPEPEISHAAKCCDHYPIVAIDEACLTGRKGLSHMHRIGQWIHEACAELALLGIEGAK